MIGFLFMICAIAGMCIMFGCCGLCVTFTIQFGTYLHNRFFK